MYAELHCLSSFSFQRGASLPRELIETAASHGYRALALTDECSLSGIVRAWEAAKAHQFHLIVGSEFQIADGPKLALLAPNKSAYIQLCTLITKARRRSPKGEYQLLLDDLGNTTTDLLALWLPKWPMQGFDESLLLRQATQLEDRFSDRLWLTWERLLHPQDRQRRDALRALSRYIGRPVVAAGDVHMHARSRKPLQDVMACIKAHTHMRDPNAPLFPNGERHLRPLKSLQRIYSEDLLRETLAIAERCTFRLDELRYEYPKEVVPQGLTATEQLRNLTEAGVKVRYPTGCPPNVREIIEKELALIAELKYEHYFLTVEEIVAFARSQSILCQGRGSAANSAVCYVLGVTEIDPDRMNLLFERFISKERGEPPDIDIDFEHQRREEVMQHIYNKYGRHRAALTATVIEYKTDSSIRDVGKALGLSVQQVDALTKSRVWWDDAERLATSLKDQGFDPDSRIVKQLIRLVGEIYGQPHYLSQHVGGFVISDDDLNTLVPVENAAMDDRTVLQWDKDDLDAMGILKIDILALGMLSAIRRSLAMISQWKGQPFGLKDVPAEDKRTYDMISRGETIGVFQIESRAQMSMLPRLRPQTFWDLVIEVAIIRPGPIQGGMVHPYLRRRQGIDQVTYPSEALAKVLKPTLGVPLFQEQVMQIAIVAAGFSPGDADQVRRSMAAWKRKGGLEKFREKLITGMLARGYSPDFADSIFQQVLGFGSYGFPMSHSASFALLTYASCWLKCHWPGAFCAALLNSQPLGFYAPAQLVNDARRNGVEFRKADVCVSDWDCTLEPDEESNPAVRLGLRMVRGLPEEEAARVVAVRSVGTFRSVEDLVQRARLSERALNLLAGAGALESLAGHRHKAHWSAAGVQRFDAVLRGREIKEQPLLLPPPKEGQELVSDYNSLGLTLGRHPLALLRSKLKKMQVVPAENLKQIANGRTIKVAGLVTHRQRPQTASGVVFATLEDDTGQVNLVVWPKVFEEQREAFVGASLIVVTGQLQSEQGVINVVSYNIEDHSHLLGELQTSSRDFH